MRIALVCLECSDTSRIIGHADPVPPLLFSPVERLTRGFEQFGIAERMTSK